MWATNRVLWAWIVLLSVYGTAAGQTTAVVPAGYLSTGQDQAIQQVDHSCPRCRPHGPGCQCPPSKVTDQAQAAPSELQPDAPAITDQPAEQFVPELAPNQNTLASSYAAARGPSSVGPNMLGDFTVGSSLGSVGVQLHTFTYPQNHGERISVPTAAHTFKIADNESPWPRTRIIFTSNYFDNIGANTSLTREMIGFERSFLDGRASLGMRLPMYTVSPGVQSLGGGANIGSFGRDTNTQTSIGDLVLISKYAVMYDPQCGNVVSVGIALVAPTGPSTVGGVDALFTVDGVQHTGNIQPYGSFYRSLGPAANQGLFLQGFVSTDTPFSCTDSTFLFNDIGLGYIYRRPTQCGITAFIPTVEAHVNTALNKQAHAITPTSVATGLFGPFTSTSTLSYTDQVNLTMGLTTVFNHRSTLGLGFVTPLNNPHPFNFEAQLLWNSYFGNGIPPFLRQ